MRASKSSRTSRRPASGLVARAAATGAVKTNPDEVRPAIREEILPVALAAVLLSFVALLICFSRGYLLLYGDAVAHLGIARRILDSHNPGLIQLGGVWLPLPHLLMLPFVQKMEWWQNGLAGAWPSLICYIASAAGFYRLARLVLIPRWAIAATAFYALNPNLLYLATTAMTEPLFLALLIWTTLLTVECVAAIHAARQAVVARRLIFIALFVLAAVYTRYDGWILGAAVWCVVTFALARRRDVWRSVVPSFVVFTLLVQLQGRLGGWRTTSTSSTIRWISSVALTLRLPSRRGLRSRARNTTTGGTVLSGLSCTTLVRRRWMRLSGRRAFS